MASKSAFDRLQETVVGTVRGVAKDPVGTAKGTIAIGRAVVGQVVEQVTRVVHDRGGKGTPPPSAPPAKPAPPAPVPVTAAEPPAPSPTEVAKVVAKKAPATKAPPAKKAAAKKAPAKKSTPSAKLPPRKQED
ncbi:hypothetical protein [Nocardioides mangrovi]|uniref:Histone n=1 Tax=Nocardioides mangrovi TaxID=2874580 RepID=A0ABS7UFW9_9ACTN|nr:hypothetical protein [Nocardioides mangrovi]MBZ5739909.1 hypothetical protein [Nocardioides mangrovi]